MDKCFSEKRFNRKYCVRNISIAIKNLYFGVPIQGFELFDYYRSKCDGYTNTSDYKEKFDQLSSDNKINKITISILHYYTISDNKEKFIKL